MRIHKPRIYVFISLTSHLLLLLAMVLYFNFSVVVPTIGSQQEKIVNSFLYHDTQMQKFITAMTKVAMKNNTQQLVDQTAQHALVVANKMQAAMKQAMTQSSSNGVQTNELLALLHAAIQQQQHYPVSAMQLERQGRVTVTFTLLPTGAINGLHMAKSSGTDSLDRAALAAVSDAAPFRHLDKLLTGPREFSLDVVFELA